MKRLRRMASLGSVLHAEVADRWPDGTRSAFVQARLAAVIGGTVARHIQTVSVRGDRLVLQTDRRQWRETLFEQRSTLLRKLRDAFPFIQELEVV